MNGKNSLGLITNRTIDHETYESPKTGLIIHLNTIGFVRSWGALVMFGFSVDILM